MASIFDRLFRRTEAKSAVETPEPVRPGVSIPAPPDFPSVLLDRVPRQQPRPAHRKGKRRTADEIEADRKALSEGMRAQGVARFEYDRKRIKQIGVTHYRWRTSGDEDVCESCRAREGKLFPYEADPEFRHPGTFECSNGHACRCLYQPEL